MCNTQKVRLWGLPSLGLIGGPAQGKVCIVTGPTSGIGKQAATELARRGAHGERRRPRPAPHVDVRPTLARA